MLDVGVDDPCDGVEEIVVLSDWEGE